MSNSPDFAQPSLGFFAPSPDMAGIIHTLFVTRAGHGRTQSMMPAYSAQFFSFITGSGTIHFPGHDTCTSGDLTLNAPMLRAAPMIMQGPVLNVGASFTPLGWATFSGLPADEVHDTAFGAETVVPQALLAPLHAALAEIRAKRMSPEDYARIVEDMIRQACAQSAHQPRDGHAVLVGAINDWLSSGFNPPIERLYDSTDLGRRQVQRLCRRYFGVPPGQLLKRFRAIRAAMLLAHDNLPSEMRSEVIGAYFDQAHLIRDIRRYTGQTPKALPQSGLVQDMLDPDGHGETGPDLRPK